MAGDNEEARRRDQNLCEDRIKAKQRNRLERATDFFVQESERKWLDDTAL
jgi:hypothetical protein